MDIWAELAKLGIGIAIAITTSIITVRMAIKRFRAEQWWSKKVQAYMEIIEELDVLDDLQNYFLTFSEKSIVHPEKQEELWKQAEKAYRALNKKVRISSFLLCDEATELLSKFHCLLDCPYDESHFEEMKNKNNFLITRCLKELPLIAKKDLGVK